MEQLQLMLCLTQNLKVRKCYEIVSDSTNLQLCK